MEFRHLFWRRGANAIWSVGRVHVDEGFWRSDTQLAVVQHT